MLNTMNPADQQAGQQGGNVGTGMCQTGQTGSGGDMLDKGVNFAEQKSGHEESPANTEKVRSVWKVV